MQGGIVLSMHNSHWGQALEQIKVVVLLLCDRRRYCFNILPNIEQVSQISMSYTSNGVIPEEVPELEDDAQSMNGEEQPGSTFERGEESRPRRGGRDASTENYIREMAASMTRLELSMQRTREELGGRRSSSGELNRIHGGLSRWHGKPSELSRGHGLARWKAYHANQHANQEWQQKMEQRFSSWPDHPSPPPQ